MIKDPAADVVQREAHWFEPTADGMGPLLDAIGDARLVLIGEATHGTHEFYRTRAELTKALIVRKGFNLVAVEADWPDAYRVNRYVRRENDDVNAVEALGNFRRFPTWMWRNTAMVEFVEWLRAHDEALPASAPQAVVRNAETYYGSMFLGDVSTWNLRDRHMAESLDALLAHLDRQVGRAKIVVPSASRSG